MMSANAMIFSLKTGNFDEQYRFYRSLVGEPAQQGLPDWARFPLPGSRLVLWREPGFQPKAGGLEMCFVVADLEASLAKLRPLVRCSEINDASHGREFFFHDPDGNRLIFYQPRQK